MTMIREIRGLIVATVERMRRPASLGTLAGAADGSASLTTEDSGETLPARVLHHYGFASRPPDGSPAVAVFRGGSSDGALVVATGAAEYSVPLEGGEVALYTPAGQLVLLDAAGDVWLRPAPGGRVMLGEDARALVREEFLSLYNEHTHPSPAGGSTGVPAVLAGEAQLTAVARGE